MSRTLLEKPSPLIQNTLENIAEIIKYNVARRLVTFTIIPHLFFIGVKLLNICHFGWENSQFPLLHCLLLVLYPMYKNRRIRGRVSQVSRLSQQTAVPRWWRIWRARTVRRRSPPPRCWGACRAVLQPQPCKSPTGTQGQPYRRGPLWEGKALEQRFQHRHNKPDQSWE